MLNEFSRIQLMVGEEKLKQLSSCSVAVFGVGGVGGYVVEVLIRSGIRKIALIDNDKVSITNINRQIIALHSTIGKYKTDVMRERILDINPNVVVKTYNMFYGPKNSSEFDFENYDYIVDAIDTVSGKISLVEKSKEHNIKIICALGAGNKINPAMLEISDISKTSVCPLARVMRYELKKRNIKNVKVVYSKENPIEPKEQSKESTHKTPPASMVFVPAAMGLMIASEIIKDLITHKH